MSIEKEFDPQTEEEFFTDEEVDKLEEQEEKVDHEPCESADSLDSPEKTAMTEKNENPSAVVLASEVGTPPPFNYSQLNSVNFQMDREIECLKVLDNLIKYHEGYMADHPEENFEIPGLEFAKKFVTVQFAACDAVKAMSAFHLPRAKALHEKEIEARKAAAAARTNKKEKAKPTVSSPMAKFAETVPEASAPSIVKTVPNTEVLIDLFWGAVNE